MVAGPVLRKNCNDTKGAISIMHTSCGDDDTLLEIYHYRFGL